MTRYKIRFGLTRQVFIALFGFSGLLASMANVSNFTACLSLNNQPCMARKYLHFFNYHVAIDNRRYLLLL